MPEGDTIHGVSRILGPHILGVPLTSLHVDRLFRGEARAARADRCEAVGKHLRVRWVTPAGETLLLRVHLGMKGSWHSYRPHEPWQRHPDRARVIIATPNRVFVCFDPKEVAFEHSRTRQATVAPTSVDHLGPDLLAPTLDFDTILQRARRQGPMALGDMLLTQTIACGIGNVYKSESLFLEGLHPWRLATDTDDAVLGALYRRAAELMRVNLEAGGWRVTTFTGGDFLASRARPKSARTWVYRRTNRPCRRCDTPIRSRLQGPMARMTWWCPTCQPPP